MSGDAPFRFSTIVRFHSFVIVTVEIYVNEPFPPSIGARRYSQEVIDVLLDHHHSRAHRRPVPNELSSVEGQIHAAVGPLDGSAGAQIGRRKI